VNSEASFGIIEEKNMKLDMIKMVPSTGERLDLTGPIPYATYQRHVNRYIFASKFVRNKSVLDIGCGPGIGARYWLSKGAKRVMGVDISEEATRDAREWNKEINGADFTVVDAQALPFSNDSFDVVIALDVIEHLKTPDKLLRECRRVIKEGGIFICSTPNKQVTTPLFKKPGNPHHVREFYTEEVNYFSVFSVILCPLCLIF